MLIAVGVKTQGDVMAQKFERIWPRTINPAEHHGGLYLTKEDGTNWLSVFDQSAQTYGVALDPENSSQVNLWTTRLGST